MLNIKDYNPGDRVKEVLTEREGIVKKRLKYVLLVILNNDEAEYNFMPHQLEKIEK